MRGIIIAHSRTHKELLGSIKGDMIGLVFRFRSAAVHVFFIRNFSSCVLFINLIRQSDSLYLLPETFRFLHLFSLGG